MPDIRLVQSIAFGDTQVSSLDAVSIDWLTSPIAGIDETQALATAIMVALNTDRRALPDDVLPNPGDTDRRGWWADTDAATIWKGWPIGCRLWLMSRDKITDAGAKQGATIERAKRYIREALDPFVSAKIASSYTTDLRRDGRDRITGTITIFRGPKPSIALQYQSLWTEFGG